MQSVNLEETIAELRAELAESQEALARSERQNHRLAHAETDAVARSAEMIDEATCELANLQTIFNAAPVGMLLLDENSQIVRVNNVIGQIVNKDVWELIEARPGDGLCCIHATESPNGCGQGSFCRKCIARNTFNHVMKTNQPVRHAEAELQLLVGGEVRKLFVLINAMPLLVGGKLRVLMTIADITSSKQTAAELRRSEVKFRTLYDSTSDAVMLLDQRGFFDCNRATVRIYGCTDKAEFCSLHPADLSPAHQPCGTDSLTLANRHIAQALKTGSHQFEWTHKRRDTGKNFAADVLLNSMELDGRQVLQAVVRDISERKRAEEERVVLLHDMQERIKEQTCIYQVSNAILERESLDEICQDVVALLPAGWQYPEITQARITLEGREFTSAPFPETEWKLASEIVVDGERCGSVEVFYTEPRQHLDEGPFLKEERRLIDGVAQALSGAVARKRAEKALKANERKLQTITDAALDAVIMMDAAGRVVHWNPAAEKTFGYSPEEMIGRELHHVLTPQRYRDAALRGFTNFTATGRGAAIGNTLELSALRKGGAQFPIEISVNAIEQHGGWWAVAVVRDITDRKLAESDLQRSKDSLKMILDSLPIGVVVVGSDKTIRQANPAALAMVGVNSASEMTGHICDSVFCSARSESCPILDEGRTILSAEKVLRTTDNREIPILKTVVPINLDGEVVLLESFTDISIQKQAEAERSELNAKLVETSRMAGMAEVATGVLHNVGNVLNNVNVSAQVVAEKVRDNRIAGLAKAAALMEQHAEDLGNFITEDERGRHLPEYLQRLAAALLCERDAVLEELESLTQNVDHIKQIVSMQQSYARKGGVITEVSVVDLIESALQTHDASFTRHRVQVVREYDELPRVLTDKHKVLQILVNLLSNARHALIATPTPTKRLTIKAAQTGENLLTIEVADNGVGISAENLTRIFEHGFTTKKDGHGFGLHSSALTAGELGGSLHARSQGEGRGATFALTIPLNSGVPPISDGLDAKTIEEALAVLD